MTKFNTSPRPPIARWFLSDNEPRLRAGWRLLAHTLLIVFFLMLFGVILSLGLLFSGLPLETLLDERSALLDGLLSLPTITVATYVARKIVDRRSFASLGFTLDRSTLLSLIHI